MGHASQTTLLRVAAFLVDALSMAIVLVLPASIASYAIAWIGGSSKVQVVWFVAALIMMIGILIRDGYRGRSPGKNLLGLRIVTPRGDGCGWGRSIVRNLPLILFPWTLVEVFLVVIGKARSGDRIAKTTVTEE